MSVSLKPSINWLLVIIPASVALENRTCPHSGDHAALMR